VAALALGLERDRNGDRRLSETTERDRSSCGFGDLNLVFVLSSSLFFCDTVLSSSLGASVGLGVWLGLPALVWVASPAGRPLWG